MNLNSESITSLGSVLQLKCFQGSDQLVREVWAVLEYGNRKHCDSEPSAAQHVEAALRHLGCRGADEETGQSHRAHACARLLLALLELTKGTDREGRATMNGQNPWVGWRR
jgi:hypothetical protein